MILTRYTSAHAKVRTWRFRRVPTRIEWQTSLHGKAPAHLNIRIGIGRHTLSITSTGMFTE